MKRMEISVNEGKMCLCTTMKATKGFKYLKKLAAKAGVPFVLDEHVGIDGTNYQVHNTYIMGFILNPAKKRVAR